MSDLATRCRPLGEHGGPQCTAQGLGAASFGDRFELLPNEAALAAVEMAWQQGLRFFDTAPWYGKGLAEHRLGMGLYGKPRGEFVLQTNDLASGCTVLHSFELPEPSPLGLYLDYEPALCPEDVPHAIAAGYGGSPGYLVNWNGADPSMLEEGWVVLTLTDDNGCVIDSSFLVEIPAPIVFEVTVIHEDQGGDGSIQLGITGGTAPYDLLWNSGQMGDTVLAQLTTGLYSWVVSDANGCTALGLQEIINVDVLNPESKDGWAWSVHEGMLTLENPYWASGTCSVHILDLSGRVLHSESWFPPLPLKVDIGRLSSRGVLSVRDQNGEVVLRGQF